MLTNRKAALVAAAVAATSAFLGVRAARATPYTWDGGDAATNVNWSDALNWMGDVGPSATADVITFDNNGIANLNNTVDAGLASTSFTQLNYRQDDPTKTYTTTIPDGVTLTLGGLTGSNGATLTNSMLVVVPTTDANTAGARTGSTVTITGGGALNLSGGNVMITGKPGTSVANDSFAILDLSGLASFTYTQTNNSVFAVGAGNQNTGDNSSVWGKLILGPSTTINSNRIVVGGQSNAGTQGSQPISSLMLGQTTTINNNYPGNFYVGGDPNAGKDGSGAVLFQAGLTSPVLSVGDTLGNRNGMEIGYQRAGTGHSVLGVLDGTSMSGTGEGEVNLNLAILTISAQSNGSAAAGGGFGMLSIGKGTVDVGSGSIIVTRTRSAASAGSLNVGVLNVGLKGSPTDTGAGLVTAGTLTLGQRIATDATSGGSLNSYVNLANGGVIDVDRVFVGNNTVAGGTQAVNANINLNGGVLTTTQIKAGSDTAPAGTTTRTINLNGGTIKAKTTTAQANLDTFMEGHTAANVYAGGGTIDTNGQDVTINQALVAPDGDGVSSITVTDGGSGYRVAPIVYISGGGGTGAAGVAQIDATGKVTGVTITSPGTGYTSAPTVQLFANGGTNPTNMLTPYGGAAATLDVATAPNTSGGITKVGAGKLVLTGANTYTGATTVKGGTLQLNINAHAPVLTGAGGADVAAGKLVLDYNGGSTPAAAVQSALAGAFASGFASGQIRSSTATTSVGLGWGDDTAAQQVTVTRAYFGDANLDGTVDTLDFNSLAANFGGSSKVWSQADFNYDGKVDTLDFNNLAANFGQTLPPDAAAAGRAGSLVPEPASLGLLALGGLAALRRRRRRS